MPVKSQSYRSSAVDFDGQALMFDYSGEFSPTSSSTASTQSIIPTGASICQALPWGSTIRHAWLVNRLSLSFTASAQINIVVRDTASNTYLSVPFPGAGVVSVPAANIAALSCTATTMAIPPGSCLQFGVSGGTGNFTGNITTGLINIMIELDPSGTTDGTGNG